MKNTSFTKKFVKDGFKSGVIMSVEWKNSTNVSVSAIAVEGGFTEETGMVMIDVGTSFQLIGDKIYIKENAFYQ